MLDATCPQCGAAIRFRSADLPVKVCDYCRTAILREGEHLELIGTVASMPDDVSPLRLGVTGRDGDAAFTLVGRVRWRWSDGAWNEWLALFDDGAHAWLGEAMGRYMLLRAIGHSGKRSKLVRSLASGGTIIVGQTTTIDGVAYGVTDVKRVTCVASEGELPFPAQQGLEIRSVDLMASDGRCATLQTDAEETLTYTGRYVTLAEVHATGLRAFDGWPMPRWAA